MVAEDVVEEVSVEMEEVSAEMEDMVTVEMEDMVTVLVVGWRRW